MWTLDSRIWTRTQDLDPTQVERLKSLFKHENPNFGQPRHEGDPPFYETWVEKDGILSLPRGGLSALQASEPGFRVVDRRTWKHPIPDFPDHKVTLRDYQGKLVQAAIQGEQGILRAATGSGKTTAALALIARLKRRSLVLVRSTALLKQWHKRVRTELGFEPGIIQQKKEWIEPVTLGMQETLIARFRRGDFSLVDQFDVLVLDECHAAGASTVYQSVDPFSARYRIGVSADETRADGLEPLIYDLFGPVICEVSEAETVASGATVDVEIAVVPTGFRAEWYKYRQDFHKLLEEMTTDDARNRLILSLARSAVSSGEQVLIFTHRIEHAKQLDVELAKARIPAGLMIGGVENEREFDRTRMRLERGELRAAVGTIAALGEGVDLPSVSRGILATPVSNNRQKLLQIKGRLCRSSDGKTHGRLAVLLDGSIYGRKPIRNFVKWFPTVSVLQGREWISAQEWLTTRFAV